MQQSGTVDCRSLSLPFLAPGANCTNRKEYLSPFHLFKIKHGRNEYIDEHAPENKWCLPQQSWLEQREENAIIHDCFCVALRRKGFEGGFNRCSRKEEKISTRPASIRVAAEIDYLNSLPRRGC